MIKSFDLISDIHLDMHVHEHNKAKESSEWGSKGYSMESYTESQFIEYFVTHQIAATDPSEVLVIAGDLGHDNFQNKLMLEYLSKVYKNIVITFGNHDLYLIPRYARQEHSTDRWNEMKRFAYDLNNVSVLEGNVVCLLHNKNA